MTLTAILAALPRNQAWYSSYKGTHQTLAQKFIDLDVDIPFARGTFAKFEPPCNFYLEAVESSSGTSYIGTLGVSQQNEVQ